MTAINSNRAIRGPVTAVPVVAGNGVRLVADTQNNRWVAEADETVLYENSATGTSGAHSVILSETLRNFERALFMVSDDASNHGVILMDMSESPVNGSCNIYWSSGFRLLTVFSSDWITWSIDGYQWYGSGGSTIGTNYLAINKIIGVNRIASN